MANNPVAYFRLIFKMPKKCWLFPKSLTFHKDLQTRHVSAYLLSFMLISIIWTSFFWLMSQTIYLKNLKTVMKTSNLQLKSCDSDTKMRFNKTKLCKSFDPTIISYTFSLQAARLSCNLLKWFWAIVLQLSEGLPKFFFGHFLIFHSFSVQSLYLMCFFFVKPLNSDLWPIQA